MGFAYLINSMGISPNLELDVEVFSRQLVEKWPEIVISPLASETHILSWELKVGGIPVLGSLQVDRQTVALENSDIFFTAEFAIFYRSVVSTNYKLFLYGGYIGEPIEITEASSVQNITKALLETGL